MRVLAAIVVTVQAAPLAAQTAESPPEPVSLLTLLGMLFFLLLAALIVVSVLCQILVAAGLVPQKGRLRRAMLWLANVVSGVRTTSERNSASSGSGKGGGGSFGGGGASGNW